MSDFDLSRVDGSILVVGLGYMARAYIKELRLLGVPQDAIVGVEIDPARAVEQGKAFEILTYTNLHEAVERHNPRYAFVLSNTPSHAGVLKRLLALGVTRVFMEKPFVFKVEEIEEVDRVARACLHPPIIEVGYLINFSPAVRALQNFIQEQDVRVLEARGLWGKDRTCSDRPTAGDAEDELTHMLCLLVNLTCYANGTEELYVESAAFSHTAYADAEAQARKQGDDASFPLRPTATSQMTVRCSGAQVFLQSSFISFEQHRYVELTLGKERPLFTARTDFDHEGSDWLRIRDLATGEIIVSTQFDKNQKLTDQIKAFLTHAISGVQADGRATDDSAGADMVRLLGQAELLGEQLQANKGRSSLEEILDD